MLRHRISACVPIDKATAAAFVDARLALAAGHRDRQLMIDAFQGWKIENMSASPRGNQIFFSQTEDR